MRIQLDPVVEEQIKSQENRRMALDILVNIWGKSNEIYPHLHQQALNLYREAATVSDRLWLHYGMTMLVYDFFHQGLVVIGQLSRFNDVITPKEVKTRMAAELGQLGALEKATERIIFSLRDWGVLVDTAQNAVYAPQRRHFAASSLALEEWLLAVAATAHRTAAMPFSDLLRLPELFPLKFSISVDHLRLSNQFEVHRQGLGYDMVNVVDKYVVF
ncbi:MAG: hypothetical protein KDE19_10615 [Caldilineaceae bacterium]|nr:hypothetical protein [Caldilineaceae bacterium]